MEDRIGSKMNSTGIISKKRSRSALLKTQLSKEPVEPDDFGTSLGHSPVFRLSRRLGNTILFLALPGNKCRAKEHTPTSNGTASVGTPGIISIIISNKIKGSTSRIAKATSNGAMNITKDAANSSHMEVPGRSHKLTNLLYNKRNIRSSVCKIE
ncbi:hypothetical protein BDE02_14G003500 [Populus trichocarpa]|nr:hypothetical protein BDE02_14G003500 [Populus trichocarpa]